MVPHVPRGNAVRDASRHKSAPRRILKIGRRASRNASPRWSVGTIIQPEQDWL
ncbi:DUF1534 domain-containing protein [Pseudomonas cannabina]|nr:DUF1534 domain-containing protein [Pseudomonas cannabina]